MSTTDNASGLHVVITNAKDEHAIPTAEFVGYDVDLDFMDDDRLAVGNLASAYHVHCTISGINVATMRVAIAEVESLINDYGLERTLRAVTPLGEQPSNYISFPEFCDMLRANFALTEEIAEFSNADIANDLDYFDGDYVTDTPDMENEPEAYVGPVNLVAHMRGHQEDVVWPAFIIPDVEEPTLVRRSGASSNNDPVALVLPAIDYAYNDAMRWWLYEEEISGVSVEFSVTNDDGEVENYEVLPALNLVPMNEEGRERIHQIMEEMIFEDA